MCSNGEVWIVWLNQLAFEVRRSGQIFFEPLDFHFEPTDLLIEISLECLLFVDLGFVGRGESHVTLFEKLLLPLADLTGMKLMASGQSG